MLGPLSPVGREQLLHRAIDNDNTKASLIISRYKKYHWVYNRILYRIYPARVCTVRIPSSSPSPAPSFQEVCMSQGGEGHLVISDALKEK